MLGASPSIATSGPVLAPFVRSAAMKTAIERFQAALRTESGVLIAGEPGTGRELMARAIHRAAIDNDLTLDELLREGTRQFVDERPFVVVDCGATTVEAALFGTLTNSDPWSIDFETISAQSGLNRARGGTLFLCQLHEMPFRQQGRLAKVLRDREAWVLNGHRDLALAPIQARVIASLDGRAAEAGGHINCELRKRFPSSIIELPPLRDRREDIPGLVRSLLHDICTSMSLPPKTASRQVMALLAALPWRGNVRELRGLLRAVAAKVPGPLVRVTDVLEHVRLDGASVAFAAAGTLKEARERFEREYVAAVLQQHRGRMAEAARTLGVQRTNLYRKVRQLAVRRAPGR